MNILPGNSILFNINGLGVFVYYKHVDYDECIWLIQSEASIAHTIEIANSSLDLADSLLFVGYGRDHHKGASRIFDVTMAKEGNWFTIYSATIWMKFVLVTNRYQYVILSVGANSNGNLLLHFSFKIAFLLNGKRIIFNSTVKFW